MNVGLECSTHGTKTSNSQTSKHRTPTYNPWNFNFKPTISHIQPTQSRPHTAFILCATQEMTPSKYMTITSSPFHNSFKLCDSRFYHTESTTHQIRFHS